MAWPLLAFLLCFGVLDVSVARAPSGPWDNFNYAPSSKTVYPTAIHSTNGTIQSASNLVANKGETTISGQGSWIALDYGKEVGGLISLNLVNVSSTSSFSFSFTESPLYIRPDASDDSSVASTTQKRDGVLHIPAPLSTGYWTQPAYALRGGFRYLTIVSNSDDPLTISNVSCAISFMPHVTDLRAYDGYFYAKDPQFHDTDFLTKIWYAGAYTVQTNTVPLLTGRVNPAPATGWYNNYSLGVAGPIIVDGAKRDRAVWPGDMGIAVPAQFVSTNDLIPTRNALSTMFSKINPTTGALPESGPPLNQKDSDTYHAWTLIGTHNYYLYSGDTDWLKNVWTNYTRAVAFLEGKVNSTVGLMNVTGLRDWARLGGGGINAEGNALLYRVLVTAADLASHVDQQALATAYANNASSIKTKFNEVFWVEADGMYRDNQTTTLYPQDANSLAVLYNLTTSKEQASRVSAGLEKNWNDIGPVAPELPDTISPFISGFELQAHFESGNDARAMDLLHRTWGFMLYTNTSVQSTLLEGFTANGSLAYRYYRGYNNDPTYTSHAHGWSAGPTSALSFYILGLTVTSPQGQTWSLAPHVGGGLPSAEGGFATPLGWYGVKWTLSGTTIKVTMSTPSTTSGVFRVPDGWTGSMLVDGKRANPANRVEGGQEVQLTGGVHNLRLSRSS